MNELMLIFHIATVTLTALGALSLGKEALITFISLVSILANLFVIKQIGIFGLQATGCDAFTIGAALGINLLQEYYGKKSAQSAIWISFGAGLFYVVMSQIHLGYQPTSFDMTQGHFYALLAPMPRIIFASLTSYLICQQADYLLFGYLKEQWPASSFILRSSCSIMLCQLLDTILFSVLGLYGIVNNILHIIIISYFIKCLTLMLSSPFLWFTKKIISKEAHEPV